MSENKNEFDEMTDHDILAELLRINKRRSLMITILICTAVCALIIISVSMMILVPQMTEAADNIDLLAKQGTISLDELNKIDFEKLNTAIEDFSKVAAKIAQWFK